jgi:undecaprenyl-diphosphatase
MIYSLKFLIKRERPLFFLEMYSKLSKGPGEILDPSFPSAHAAYSFMMATLLATWFPRYRVLFFILAGFIGWTRIYLGLHYPIDVIAGGILGYAITKFFLHWASRLEITKESIIEKTCSSKISPNPSFPKRGNSSLL